MANYDQSKSTHMGAGAIMVGGSADHATLSSHVVIHEMGISTEQLNAAIEALTRIINSANSSPAAEFAPEKIQVLEKAKTLAIRNDTDAMLSTLKGAGQWLADFASKVGQPLALEALRKAMGF
jgi:hypothetical protein